MTDYSRPYSFVAERRALGWAMIKPEWAPVLDRILDAKDYYEHRHQWYHSCLVELGPRWTFAEMEFWLRERSAERHWDRSYISALYDHVVTEDEARSAASLVRRLARARGVIDAAARVAASAARKGWAPTDEWVSKAETMMLAPLRDARHERRTITLAEQVPLCILEIEEAGKPGAQEKIVRKTGFGDIDRIIGGMRGGDVIVVAGRPSMGKTAFAVACAWGCGEPTAPALVLTAEMGAGKLTKRMLAAKAKVDGYRLANGGLSEDDWERIMPAAEKLVDGSPIIFAPCSGWRMSEVCSEARVTAATTGLGLIVVDYIQLLHGDNTGRYRQSREREVAGISAALKSLAVELDVPIIEVSQLNRGLESRPDKRPMLSDLRESGAIEQDADIVMFLYRDEVYYPRTTEPGICEVIIAKNRDGRTGRARLRWTDSFTRFDDFTEVDP